MIVRLVVVAWFVAGVVGSVQSARAIAPVFSQSYGSEFDRRQANWARTYGFAMACGNRLLPESRVLLLNPALGPGEIRQPVQTTDPDATHFAYTLEPRLVSVNWDLSTPFLPLPGEADYIAAWLNQPNPSASQRRAMADEMQLLESTFGPSIVCRYGDDQGNLGAIYAFSGPAVGAVDPALSATATVSESSIAQLPTPYDSATATLRAYAGLASLWAMGILLLLLLVPRGLGVPLLAGLALPVGCLVALGALISLSFLRIAWSPVAAAVPIAALAAALAVSRPRWTWRARVSLPAWSALEYALVAVLAGGGALLFAIAPLGIPRLDGFSAGLFKADAFWANASMLPFYEHVSAYTYTSPTHPPFVSLLVDWLYLATGQIHEHAVLILWPAMWSSVLLILYGVLRQLTTARFALWSVFAFALAASDLVSSSTQYGYADLALALMLLAGVGLVWLWTLRSDSPWQLTALAGALLAGAAWTKEEGIIAAPVAIACVFCLSFVRRSEHGDRWWLAPCAMLAAYALLAGPLMYLKFAYPAMQTIVHGDGLVNAGTRLPIVLIGFALRIVQHWSAALVVALAAALLLVRYGAAQRTVLLPGFWIPSAIIVVQVAADVAGISVNTMEVHAEISQAVGRLLLQLTPVVYLTALTLWLAALRERRQSTASDCPVRQVRRIPLASTAG